MKNISDKSVLITGASRGIGSSMAKKFAAAGAKVIVNFSHGKEAADQTVKAIQDAGGTAYAIQADVSKASDVKHLFDEAIAQFGNVDILVNNAGIIKIKPLKDTTDDDFDKQFNINVRGVFNTMREAATRLTDNGSIINFSTSVNRVMVPGYSTYVATKAAVEQYTKVFAKEIGSRGINVNSVSPGPVDTELFTNGKSEEEIARLAAQSAFNRIGEPEDIASVVLFLASDEAKWISAQNIGINGAFA